MQVLFFIALFGLFAATVLGLTGGAALNTIQLQERQVEDTKQYFRDVAFLVTQHTVMEDVLIPYQADTSDYLKMDAVARGSNWIWGDGTKDPWGNDIFVYMVQEVYNMVSAGGSAVRPVASAFVLASPGPDMAFEDQLQNQLDGLTHNSGINTIMRLEADPDSDDIVYTFNTMRALDERWEMMAWNLRKLGEIYLTTYQQKYADTTFENTLQDYYNEALDRYFSGALGGGTFDIEEDLLATWKKPVAGVSNSVKQSLNNFAPDTSPLAQSINNLKVGDNEYVTFLESNLSTTGLQIRASSSASIAGASRDDVLELRLEGTGTNGQSWRKNNQNLTYRIQLGG